MPARQLLSIVVLLVLSAGLNAQEHFGIMGSSRAPANTMLLNPSTICDSRAFIDIHLVGAGAFARNNFAFIPGDKFSLGSIGEIDTVHFNRSAKPIQAYAHGFVQGPGATFAWREHAFALYTGVRTVADARGIPEELGYYITDGFDYAPLMGQRQAVRDVRSGALGWGELGLSYATIIDRKGDVLTLGGITVKRLFGIAGAGVRLDEWTFTVEDSTSLQTHTVRGEYGFNDGGWNSGSGWSADLGVTFKKMKRGAAGYTPHSPCTDGSYVYRLGISLLELGSVRFKPQFYRNVFNETEGSQWNDFNAANTDGTSELDSLISSNFDLVESNSDEERFRMKLPTGVSVQLDYNLGYNFYVFSTLTFGLPRRNTLGVQRASSLAVVPRWEIKRFEVAMPVSLYQFNDPQVGLAVRLNSVIIGSDNLGWLFGADVYGADIYVHLKYTIFRHWNCNQREKRDGVRRTGRGKSVPCPAW